MIDFCGGEKCNLAVSDKQHMRHFLRLQANYLNLPQCLKIKYFSDPISSCELRGQALCVSVTLVTLYTVGYEQIGAGIIANTLR